MKKTLIALLIATFILPAQIHAPSASAQEIDVLLPQNTNIGKPNKSWSKLTETQFKFLKKRTQLLEFQGSECKFISASLCEVVSSDNSSIKVGDSIQIMAVKERKSSVSTAAFQARCSWCSYLITSIEIVAFVVAAPTATPAWMVYSLYIVGSSIIVGNL